MDLERALISKIITTGNLEEVISRGIRDDLFHDEECREMFRYLIDHTRQHRTPPSLSAVRSDRPKFEFEMIDDPLSWLIGKFVVLCKRRLANEQVVELAKACDDPERAENIDMEFLEVSRKLATLIPTRDVASFTGDMGKRIDEYERRVAEGHLKGIPFGFPSLDEWTKGGIKKHQFVTVAGFTGNGKSTLLKCCAYNAWVQGYTPLYFSLEEDAEEIYERLDAMAAQLPYTDLSHLRLPPEAVANWREYAASLRERVEDIPVLDTGRNVTPDTIYAEMVRHKPSIVIIDYLSLMRSSVPQVRGSSMWTSLTEITQDLKMIARTMKIPIFAAAQTNRSGGKDGAMLDNIGYSMSVVQDADISLGLFADDEMKERKEIEIRVNKNRRGRLGKFIAIWDHENLIFREKTENDFFKREKELQKRNPFMKEQ